MELEELVAWGLLSRGLGLVYLIFFASLAPQLPGLVRLFPPVKLLERIGQDFPRWEGLVRFPTLAWLAPRRLPEINLIGLVAAVGIVLGGDYGPWLHLVAWMVALSLVTVVGDFVVFTWDLLLLEAGFLALFLPAAEPLPGLALGQEPPAALGFAFTFLLARMMLGMGKCKFLGDWRQQPLFIKWFYSFQPLPTWAAWYLAKLPDGIHRWSLWLMFFIEVVAPGFLFLGYPWVGLLIVGLQVAIAAAGNFGLFNLLTALLCLPALAGFRPSWTDFFSHPVALVVVVTTVGGLLYFPPTAWTSNSWIYMRHCLWKPLVSFYRWLHPFHLANGYGVFEVQETPADGLPDLSYRAVVVIEGSDDGRLWREYGYRYHSQAVDRRPPFFAPHHPRVDHHLYYEAWQMRMANINLQNPYYLGTYTWFDRLLQGVLRGDETVLRLLGHNPFPGRPPRWLRVRRYAYRFTTSQERAETGHWYVRTALENHLDPIALNQEVDLLPSPSQFRHHLAFWRSRFGLDCDPPWTELEPRDVIDCSQPERLNRAGRHFVYREGVWVDALFEPGREVVTIRYASRAYRRLLARYPGLEQFSDFPASVLVAWGEGAVLFATFGDSSLLTARLERVLGSTQDGWPTF